MPDPTIYSEDQNLSIIEPQGAEIDKLLNMHNRIDNANAVNAPKMEDANRTDRGFSLSTTSSFHSDLDTTLIDANTDGANHHIDFVYPRPGNSQPPSVHGSSMVNGWTSTCSIYSTDLEPYKPKTVIDLVAKAVEQHYHGSRNSKKIRHWQNDSAVAEWICSVPKECDPMPLGDTVKLTLRDEADNFDSDEDEECARLEITSSPAAPHRHASHEVEYVQSEVDRFIAELQSLVSTPYDHQDFTPMEPALKPAPVAISARILEKEAGIIDLGQAEPSLFVLSRSHLARLNAKNDPTASPKRQKSMRFILPGGHRSRNQDPRALPSRPIGLSAGNFVRSASVRLGFGDRQGNESSGKEVDAHPKMGPWKSDNPFVQHQATREHPLNEERTRAITEKQTEARAEKSKVQGLVREFSTRVGLRGLRHERPQPNVPLDRSRNVSGGPNGKAPWVPAGKILERRTDGDQEGLMRRVSSRMGFPGKRNISGDSTVTRPQIITGAHDTKPPSAENTSTAEPHGQGIQGSRGLSANESIFPALRLNRRGAVRNSRENPIPARIGNSSRPVSGAEESGSDQPTNAYRPRKPSWTSLPTSRPYREIMAEAEAQEKAEADAAAAQDRQSGLQGSQTTMSEEW
ncbi:hypothetical protein EJ08DRAFT_304497 [Tothia fuscella]|uniref:Uncharacterized protein n=1 Tax=Tothia fuscella TaxID=1048955 RepID=A0A9P4NNQ8_9PEZI|nr:hypothetical protein EJ08DRAFT_304497 [Tothia fuscella]